MKIIFLDVDGVLNGYNIRLHIVVQLIRLFKQPVAKYINIFSVHIMKVFILFLIVKLSGSKVVLSSSWRGGYWQIPVEEMSDNTKKLYNLFKFFHIDIIGITPYNPKDRGAQIKAYINNCNYKIESFVIIDDEMFDIKDYYPKDRLLCTIADPNRLIKYKYCGIYDGAGLKFKHIILALKILKRKIK